MNKDVSNRTLAVLFIIALIVISLGFVTSHKEQNMVSKRITGKQSAFGFAKVNISELLEVNLIKDSIDFGIGYRNQSLSPDIECNLSTYDTTNPDCWVNTTPYPPANFSHFQIENTGTVYANITINSSNATDFFGGPVYGGMPRYIWRGITVPDDDGCPGGYLVTDFTSFNNSEQTLCGRLRIEDDSDTFNISINISIPSGPVGQKTASVTFIARTTN